MTIPIPYQWKRLSPNRRERLDRCIVAYLRRLYRQEDPSGSFRGCGRNGLPPWFPSYGESQPCCGFSTDNSIIPTRANPLALNTHCRSIGHLANLYDVDLNFLHRQLRLIWLSRVPALIDAEQLIQQANDYIEHYRHELEEAQHELEEVQLLLRYISAGDIPMYSCGVSYKIDEEEGYISAGQLKQQASDYAERICNTNSRKRRYSRERRYFLDCIEISADPLEQQANEANDYAERMCGVNSRERHTLDYIEGYIAHVEGSRIHLRNIINAFGYQARAGWIDLEALGYYQEGQGRRRTPPTPELDEPVQPGKLPFDPEIDVEHGDIDDFLSELG